MHLLLRQFCAPDQKVQKCRSALTPLYQERTYMQNGEPEILFNGFENSADMMPKCHSNLEEKLNGDFWRTGSKLLKNPDFPNVEGCIVYAQLRNQTFTFFGLPNSFQYIISCQNCSVNFEVGQNICDQLVRSAQMLCFQTSTLSERKSAVTKKPVLQAHQENDQDIVDISESLPDNFLFSKLPQCQPLLKYWVYL